MKAEGLVFDFAHTSLLTRAVRTCNLALEAMDQMWLPLQRHWRLNERHYGALQGKDKKETLAKYGEEQFKLWRRSFDVPPPPIDSTDPYSQANDARYADLGAQLPATECLKDVVTRMIPYWQESIIPDLKAGKRVLVTAHGNSLRALVMFLENISETEISELNIPTGVPRLYALRDDLSVKSAHYLGDADAIAAATDAVARQATQQP